MRQRVLLAAALAGEPALLVADEPTAALDVTIQAQILELLDGLRQRRGLTLLLITHDLAVVAEVCDRVAVMYGGRLAELGPVDAVFGRPAHPYTRGLLDSLPVLEAPDTPLRPIRGMVPAPGRRPDGCRFRDRCPRAWDRCRTEPPRLPVPGAAHDHRRKARREEATRWSRCWLVETGDLPVVPAPEEGGS
jgi:oligopeptide/dipeptide ABC transporter ATP-binding protein